jgi:hypothetical protein
MVRSVGVEPNNCFSKKLWESNLTTSDQRQRAKARSHSPRRQKNNEVTNEEIVPELDVLLKAIYFCDDKNNEDNKDNKKTKTKNELEALESPIVMDTSN